MRVLVVSRASYRLPVSQGGTDAYALRTATYLVPQGHEVYLVGQGEAGPAFGSIHFVRVPTRVQATSRSRVTYFLKAFLLNCAAVLSAWRFLRAHPGEIDIVHCNSNLAVLLLGFLYPGIPVVYTIHDPLDSPRPPAGRSLLERAIRPFNNGLLERWALHRADHVIAVSAEIRDQVQRVLDEPTKLTLLFPFSRPAPRPSSTATHFDASVMGRYVLSVGAQTGRKRFDLLIQALPRIPASIGLVLVGSGPDRLRLRKCAAEAGAAQRVVFLDHVDEHELSELYRGALVYAMASTREGFPATLMEASMSGTPTLYFTDGNRSDLEAFQSDFFRVIHSLEPARVADAINRACTRSPGPNAERGQIARWARSRFPSPEAAAGVLGRIYDELATTELVGGPTEAAT